MLTGAEATRVLFKKAGTQSPGKKSPRVAEAVEFVSGGQKHKVKAKREIIISAGTSTPSLPTPRQSFDRQVFDATRYLFRHV